MGKVEKDGFTAVRHVLARADRKDWIPSVWLKPEVGGLSTAAALAAPASMTLHLEGDELKTDAVAEIYDRMGASAQFEVVRSHQSLEEMVRELQD